MGWILTLRGTSGGLRWPTCHWCDGYGAETAPTCLFQSYIVCQSVSTVHVASQQPASCVHDTLPHKRNRTLKKKGMCFLSQHMSFHEVNLPFSSFIRQHTHSVAALVVHAHKCLDGMATHFQNGIEAWQHTHCQIVCGPVALLFPVTGEHFVGLATSVLWETLNLNELHINTEQCCHLLPINPARFTSCGAMWSLGFPRFILVKSTTLGDAYQLPTADITLSDCKWQRWEEKFRYGKYTSLNVIADD